MQLGNHMPVRTPPNDAPCADCGEDADYVDPDSGLCDLCTAVKRATEDTVSLDKLRAELKLNT